MEIWGSQHYIINTVTQGCLPKAIIFNPPLHSLDRHVLTNNSPEMKYCCQSDIPKR